MTISPWRLGVLFLAIVAITGSIVYVRNRNVAVDVSTSDASTPLDPGFSIKGLTIGADGWNREEVVGNGLGNVGIFLFWAYWDSVGNTTPCAPNQTEFEGYCYTIDAAADEQVLYYSSQGVNIIGGIGGMPYRLNSHITSCGATAQNNDRVFCAVAAQDLPHLQRFARMVAQRYDGNHGHGKINDFVVGNEVNQSVWYNPGCGLSGTPARCTSYNYDTWASRYAAEFNAVYDGVSAVRSDPIRVYISLAGPFSSSKNGSTYMSVQTLLMKLAPLISPRPWYVSQHFYENNLQNPTASADDLRLEGQTTIGSPGAIVGWLWQQFPNLPAKDHVITNESGISSRRTDGQNGEALQAQLLCLSFQNFIGTPGLDSYLYHRMKDHPAEIAGGLALGLRRPDNSAKPAWSTWALANRPDVGQVSCGFENLPFTKLTRSQNTTRGYWTSTRVSPAGFTADRSWKLLRTPQSGTSLLFECAVGNRNLISKQSGCEGLMPLGPVGYVHDTQVSNTIPLYRCVHASRGHFVSDQSNCESQTSEGLLGYAYSTSATTPTPTVTVTATPTPADQAPQGALDGIRTTDNHVVGWALDADEPSQSISVHVFIDGTGVGTATFGAPVDANVPRPDVNNALGYPGDHGFELEIPNEYRDGQEHTVYAYAINIGTGPNPLLVGSPKTFRITPESTPTPTPTSTPTMTPTPTPASNDILISGFVLDTTTFEPFGGVAIDNCRSDEISTDITGFFSFTLQRGDRFCVQIDPIEQPGHSGPTLKLNTAVQGNTSYLNQVAGITCAAVTTCTNDEFLWDKATDRRFYFLYRTP